MTQTEIYAYYRDRHRCVMCHGQDAYTLSGRAYCAECTERNHAYGKKYRSGPNGAKQREKMKLRTAERRKHHLCTYCGAALPEGSPFVRCDKCRAMSRNAKQKQTERRTGFRTGEARMRWVYGLCVKCGRPVADGVNHRGEPLRLCPTCYAATLRAQHMATAASQSRKEAQPWIRDNVIAFASTAKYSPRSIS